MRTHIFLLAGTTGFDRRMTKRRSTVRREPNPQDRRVTFQKNLRAMNRRRFVPSTEGLEGRALQAATGLNVFGFQLTTNLNVPITYQQKAKRIEHLPYYLGQIHPGRFLPQAEIQQIQGALFNMMDSIQKPVPQVLDNFNYQIRQVLPKDSLAPADIAVLNHGVAAVLGNAKAPESSIQGISNALQPLMSQVDTASVMPVYLASNDATLVLQTALAIGRPMPPPQLPKIKRNTGINAGPQHFKTPLERPILVGTYHYHTTMQVVTPEGVVVGEVNVHRNNNYRVQITTPQSVGVHEFRLQALDSVGHVSRIGPPFLIKVVPKKHHSTAIGKATPQGPLATAT
jgi:hypothetical protein